MLTPAERTSLLLTLAFLLLGAGIKLWVRSRVELGPSPTQALAVAEPDSLAPAPEDPADPEIPREESAPVPPATEASLVFAPEAPVPPAPRVRKPRGPAAARKSAPSAPLDVNRARPDELAQVPGIGPRTAVEIVAFRKARGRILEIRELLQVKGIGEKKLERLAPHLIVSPMGEEERPRQAGRIAESDGIPAAEGR